MSPQTELAIIVLGHKQSPFVKMLVDRDDLPVTWVCCNALDFQLYHADPAKRSTYHLEFTNLLEIKARSHIESLSIFETLGKFLEFYNPLKISTLNYLITKYVTSINPSHKGLLATWNETVRTIFDGNSILPLFEEGRVLHVKVDGVEIPARQYIITKENEKKRDDTPSEKAPAVTGIVDLEEIEKLKLCDDTIRAIKQSPGVIIVPTDLLSLHMVLRCEPLISVLKQLECKITLVSPFWDDGPVTAAEREILERTPIDSSLTNLANKVKDFVDTLIVDDKDADKLQKITQAGIDVLVENLDPAAQASEPFLNRVLASVDFSLETNKRKRQGKIVSLGEKIVSLLSERFAKKGPDPDEKPVAPPGPIPPEVSPATIAPASGPASIIPQPVPPLPGAAPGPIPQVAAPLAAAVAPLPGTVPAVAAPSLPATAPLAAAVAPLPSLVPPAIVPAQVTPELKPAPPKRPTTGDVRVEEITPDILKEIDRVLVPKYDATIEGVLSALLAVIEKPRLLPVIYKILVDKLEKLNDLAPDSRAADIITYLAAHDPGAFTDLLSELISDAMKQDDLKLFYQLMHTISLIMSASQVKRQEVLRDFIKESMVCDVQFSTEKARRLLNYFINKEPGFAVVICKTLVDLLTPELESPKPNITSINNLVFFLLSIDASLVGETIVTDMPEAVHPRVKALLEAVSCGQSFNKIVINIIDAYQAGEYDALKKALNVKKVPAHVQVAVLKKKYVAQLLKAGSVPLEMFANKIGMTLPEAEKLIYEMILKGDISAKMEVVAGKLYIVKDEKKGTDSVKAG